MTHFPRGHHEPHPHLPEHPAWVHDGDDFHAPPVRRSRPARHPVDPLAVGIVAAGGLVAGVLILWSMLDHGSRHGAAPTAGTAPGTLARINKGK